MKKAIPFIACCMLYVAGYGQKTITTSLYQQQIDYYLGPLDKTQIPTGVLYDRVFPFAVLDSLSTATTTFTTSRNHFMQAWSELYDASYNAGSILTPEEVENVVRAKKKNDTIAIGVLNYRFNIIDSNSISNNLLYRTSDTLLHDVIGRTQSPYINRQILLAAPLIDEVTSTTVVFQFPANLLLQNNTKNLNSLTVNDGQSQTVTLTPGSSFTTTYQTTGTKILTFTANFSNGTTQTVQGTMKVTGIMRVTGAGSYPVINPCDPTTRNYQATVSFADYGTSTTRNGEGEIGYYYANCANKKVMKPIIILDGFDPGDVRDVTEIYGLLTYTDASGSTRHFGEDMRALGYDIIVLNFPYVVESVSNNIPILRDGGADYIERNAFVLTRLIKDINTQLTANRSTEKITVIGPSMGGLISRYALAYLEKTSYNHNCKLWLSFDSPHLGANIPIGDQWWLEYYARVAKNNGAKDKVNKVLGSVAAKQMLIHHWLSGAQAAAGAPTFRTTFDQNLHNNGVAGSNGYPKSYGIRKIAVTNGSGAGRLQQGTSCGKVLQMDVYTRGWIRLISLLGLIPSVQVSNSNVYFRPDKGATCQVFSAWFGKTIFSNPHNETQYAQTPSYTTGYDAVPGGSFNTQAQIQAAGTNDAFSKLKFSNVVPTHAFIPSVSALDLSTAGTIDWASDLSKRNLACSPNVSGGKETPFDSYFMPSNNEDHVFLSAASVAWIKNEITGQPQPPFIDNTPVNSIQLVSGYEPICTNTTTYQLTGFGGTTGVSWTRSPATVNLAVDPNNATIVNVSRISNGDVTLTATGSLCGSLQVSRLIKVGPPVITGISYSPNGACTNGYQTWSLNASSPAPVSSWQWTVDNPSSGSWYIQYPNSPSTMVDVKGGGGISVTATNACGSTKTGVTIYSNCPMMLVASPNPATDDVTVSAAQTQDVAASSKKSVIYQIKVMDQSGNLKKQYKYASGVSNATISLKGLISGVYVIQAFDGTSWSSVQVIKK